jgi:hypothetical protein
MKTQEEQIIFLNKQIELITINLEMIASGVCSKNDCMELASRTLEAITVSRSLYGIEQTTK